MRTVDVSKGAGEVAHYWRMKSVGEIPWELRSKPVCASTEIELSNWLLEKPL